MKTKKELLELIDGYVTDEQEVKVELDTYDDRYMVGLMSK